MPDAPPLTGASFYDSLPPPNHRTGDIWRGLPTFGMLNCKTISGIVLTPACDLANRKTETITYLPIISASEYLVSAACRYECWLEITPVLSRLPNFGAVFPPERFALISDAELVALIGAGVDGKGKPLSSVEMERVRAYQQYVANSRLGKAAMSDIRAICKVDRFNSLLSRLATNAFKPDIHFLPADAESYGARPIPVHSVVLLRYPLTVPVSTLDLAQNASENQWQLGRHDAAREWHPVLEHMPDWPVKLASLRGEFLSDLISRYLGIHIRLGSEDFDEQMIRRICSEIGG
jgi:hypothetical protein